MLERLPVPFGLVRYGVAPDHQGTKAVVRLFERTLGAGRVRFFGHVEVGADVVLAELAGLYDAVVLATGAARDRRLGIPGEALPGVFGSGAFVGWYNDHPAVAEAAFEGVRCAVVIGNGNVALDVARILAKASAEFAGSDLSPAVTDRLSRQPLELIHIVGRRGPAAVKFTTEELAEFRTLARASLELADPGMLAAADPAENPNLEILGSFAASPGRRAVTVRFHFNLRPVAYVGDTSLQAVEFEDRAGRRHRLPAQLAVTCIGYEATSCDTLAPLHGMFANAGGRIGDALYVIGWAGHGPQGTIPASRVEAKTLAKRIAAEVGEHRREGAAGLAALLAERGVQVVDHAGWQRIDAAERARAATDRCREKFASVASMLRVMVQ